MTTPARHERTTPGTTAVAWPEYFCTHRSGVHAADWTAARTELTRFCLGPERRAGTSSAYAEPRRRYIGYLRSTSSAKPDLFAVRHARFKEKALRLLAERAHGGVLREEAVFTVLLPRRPGGER